MIIRFSDQHGFDPVHVQRNLAKIINPPPERFMAAIVWYFQLVPQYGLRWDFCLAQAALETSYSRSKVCVNSHNWAGIKIPSGQPSPGTYRVYPDDLEGITDHIHHLARYTGLWVPDTIDPTRNTRIPALLQQKLGVPYISDSTQLNGIWAVPGTAYAQNIEKIRQRLFYG